MNKAERIAAIKAMDLLTRCVNNEEILVNRWFAYGVADGDITEDTTGEDLEYYLEDDNFRDLIKCFLICIKDAYKDGGLYIDGIVSP